MLGPSDLYKLVKEIGKFVQNIRTLGTDLSTTFENNMESTLQLDELRKAQRELNDAFSFRRSINVDEESAAFSVQAGSAQEAEAAAVTAVVATTTEASDVPKKIRRRVRRKINSVPEEDYTTSSAPSLAQQSPASFTGDVPDLEMPSSSPQAPGISKEEAALIDDEFDKYIGMGTNSPQTDDDSWFGGSSSSKTPSLNAATASPSPEYEDSAQSRFQQQLSGTWNDQVLAAGDKLEPMALVMNKIALLEQEKKATLQRLEEEFAQRSQLEKEFYEEQRRLLEDAATQVQNAAFGLEATTVAGTGDSSSSKAKTKV